MRGKSREYTRPASGPPEQRQQPGSLFRGHLYGFGAKSMEVASPFHCGGTGSGSVTAAGERAKAPWIQGSWETMLVKKEEEEEESHRRIKKLKISRR